MQQQDDDSQEQSKWRTADHLKRRTMRGLVSPTGEDRGRFLRAPVGPSVDAGAATEQPGQPRTVGPTGLLHEVITVLPQQQAQQEDGQRNCHPPEEAFHLRADMYKVFDL